MSLNSFGFAYHARAFAAPLGIVLLTLSGCSSKPKSPESAVSAPAQQSSAAAPAPAPASSNLETTDAEAATQPAKQNPFHLCCI
jgi:hypothetical protein